MKICKRAVPYCGMMSTVSLPAGRLMQGLPTAALEQVAAYFQALAEPTRLQILNLLRDGERNVGDLAAAGGTTAANVSRHLALLAKHGLVSREGRGTSVYYRIADESIYALCDLVCGNIARDLERSAAGHAAFAQTVSRAAPPASGRSRVRRRSAA